MAKLAPPNYTQIPNMLLTLMPEMSESELKIALAIARETFGWHRNDKKLSLTRLSELTGLSRKAVVAGVQRGLDRNIIIRKSDSAGYFYKLKVEHEVSKESNPPASVKSTPAASVKSTPAEPVASVNYTPAASVKSTPVEPPASVNYTPELGENLHQYKEERKSKENYVAPNGAAHSRLMDYLHANCGPYPDGAAQGKAVKWLLDSGYTPEQCEACLTDMLKDPTRKYRVSWLGVQKEIATWALKHPNFQSPEKTAAKDAVKRWVKEAQARLGCETCRTSPRKPGEYPFGKGYLAYPYGTYLPPPCPGCNPRHEQNPNHEQYLRIQAMIA